MGYDHQLSHLSFFQGIGESSLRHLWEAGQVRSFSRGHHLIRAKDHVNALYIQISGKSFVYTLTHQGQRKIHFILGAGELLNQNTISRSLAASYVETLETSVIFCIPVEAFERCMQEDFGLTRALIRAQERKLWRLEHQIKNTVSSLYMERKLAAKLWKLARDFGVEKPEGIEIDVDFSVSFLADMLGAPRETASRLRNTLARYGLISVSGRRITVVDPARMAHFYKTGELAMPQE